MAKAKPLKERMKVWATKISRLNRKILIIHNDFRNFCHHPLCKSPNECPQKDSGTHARCGKRLGIHTALLWIAKERLRENVIDQLYAARLCLKDGHVGYAYNLIKCAKDGLDRFDAYLRLFKEAGRYHHDHELWGAWNKVIIKANYSYAIPNTAYELERLVKTIKGVAIKAGLGDSCYFKDDV